MAALLSSHRKIPGPETRDEGPETRAGQSHRPVQAPSDAHARHMDFIRPPAIHTPASQSTRPRAPTPTPTPPHHDIIDSHIYVPAVSSRHSGWSFASHRIALLTFELGLVGFKRQDRQRFALIEALDESTASDRLFRHLLHSVCPDTPIIRTTTSYTAPPHLPLHFIGPIVPP